MTFFRLNLPASASLWLGCALVLSGCLAIKNPAHADHLVAEYPLACSDDFPCDPKLHRRIHFWIQVFKEWDGATAILHDADRPERVYSVLKTGHGCAREAREKIAQERKRLKTALYNVAAKLDSGAMMRPEEAHLAGLFPEGDTNLIRTAAEKKIRCQSGVRDNYVAGLRRFHRHRHMVDRVIEQYELPADIRYLPFVESAYNPMAYSKAGAAGMWQIMPGTARVLGLELDAAIDERLDPEAATHAAAKYLVDARHTLTRLARKINADISDQEISPFVITSYNYGVNGMRRAMRSVEPDYLSVLERYKSAAFQVAVKNFYASFLAARHVALNAERYFGAVSAEPPLRYDTVVLNYAVSVARIKKIFNLAEPDLRPINPGLTRFVWNGWRMIPAGYQLKLPRISGGYSDAIVQLQSLAPETVVPGSESYTVRRGDTACGIARAMQVNCRELIRINRLGKRALIRTGQKLQVPRKLVVVETPSARGPAKTRVTTEDPAAQPQTYRVKRGDTACAIARRFAVRCKDLIALNNLGRKAVIRINQRLRIPGPGRTANQIAGLDENNLYRVRKGDTACGIAERFAVGCRALRELNRLNRRAVIYPGQKLEIPGLQAQSITDTAEELAQVEKNIATARARAGSDAQGVVRDPGLANLLDTLPDLRVSISEQQGQPVYRIRVEAEETLGHYADWMGIGSTQSIRNLNDISRGRSLRVGQSLRLPAESSRFVEGFERRRIDYHQVLNESLKSHYTLAGVTRHTVQNGESIWSLATGSGFPVWLFYRLNPQYRVSTLKHGQVVILPQLEEL